MKKLGLTKGVFSSLRIYVKTYLKTKENNNFSINFIDEIKCMEVYLMLDPYQDFDDQTEQNYFKNINKEVDINIDNVIALFFRKT